jgi:hypothetical protein
MESDQGDWSLIILLLSYGPQIAIYKYCGYTNNNCIIHFSILLTIKLTCLFSHSFLNMDEDDDDDLVRKSTVFYWTEVKIIYINSYSIIGRGYFSGVKSIWLTTFCIPLVSIYTCKNLTSKQVCQQAVNKMYSHCLSQLVNRFGTTCWQLVTTLLKLSDLLQGCSDKYVTCLI